MKITTQRSLLWTVNFVIVFALIACVALMAKKGGSYRNRDLVAYRKTVDKAVNIKLPKQDPNDSSQAWKKFRVPLDANFHFEGYVKPPEVEKKPEGKVEETAPKLETLIAVQMVLAPIADSGPMEGAHGAASIRIVSKKAGGAAGADGIFTYEVGDIIGIEQDYRSDKDPMLEKWGPCRLLEVKDSAIVCSWNKDRDQVEVTIDLSAPSGTEVLVRGEDGKILFGGEGALRGKPEVGGVTQDSDKLTSFRQLNDTNLVSWTPRGLQILDEEGEKLLDDVVVEAAKGGDGLMIKSLPSRLSEFGIQPGDVITAIDGQTVKNKESAVNYVRKTYKKKSHYGVTVLRDGKTRNLQVDVPRKLSDANKMTRNLRFGK